MPLRKPQWSKPYVFAISTVATALSSGLTVHLYVGEAWDATDPIVIERQDLFADDPPVLHRTTKDPLSLPAL
jgi:hypothetical protein